MQEQYIQDKTFEKINFTQQPLMAGEYENCIFTQCDFFESTFINYKFIDCVFKDCNLSMVKLDKTTLRDVKFYDCKMLGLRFDLCNTFGLTVYFESCQLDHSSFYKLQIAKTVFKDSSLKGIDFVDANLTSAVFDNCDLIQAVFENTILEKADLRSAFNYAIDPEMNKIKKAKFSLPFVTGLLAKYDIVIQK